MTELAAIHCRTRAKGFALIEAMVAVVVLAAGLLALTALQGALMRASADAKARSQVAAYMSSELDRVRTGAVLQDQSATPNGTDPISRAAQAAGLSVLTQTVTSQTFYADATGNFAVTNPNTGKNAYFRRVTLNTGWTDATGATRQLSMTTDMSPLTLTASKVLVDRQPNLSALRPIVRRQNPITEGMIPLATGGEGNEATAATNPKPKLLGGESGTYVSDTRFDVLTYSAPSGTPANFVQFNKKIETAVVGCTCRNDTQGFSGSGPGAALRTFLGQKGFRPTFWDGTTYKIPEASASVTTSPADVSQSPLCDVCCRDHKDPTGVTGAKFSPWPGQDPRHYTATLDLATSTDRYVEACRVIRVDGTFRVAADPMIQDLAFVPTQAHPSQTTSGSLLPTVLNNNAATSPRLAEDGKTFYENYAYQGVNDAFYSTGTLPATGNASVDYAAIQDSSSLNLPTYVPIKPTADRRWMHARVFMTDYLESDARARLVKASTECTNTTSAQFRAQCVLPFLPLASINTTEIAVWSPREATAAEQAGAPGVLNTLALPYLNYASSRLRRFNSGLALFGAINPAEDPASQTDPLAPALDEQLFVQLSALPPTTPVWLSTPSPNPSTARFFGNVTDPLRGYAQTSPPLRFNLNWAFPSGSPPSPVAGGATGDDPTARVTDSSDCTPNTSANNTTNPHGCNAPQATGVEVTLVGYNRIETEKINNPCSSGSSTSNKPQCVVYTFTSATVDAPAGSVNSATPAGGSPGKLDEAIRFTLPTLSSNAASPSTVTVNFTRSTPATTYTCLNNQPVWTVPCE